MYIFIAQKNETNYQGKNIFAHLTVRENRISSITAVNEIYNNFYF